MSDDPISRALAAVEQDADGDLLDDIEADPAPKPIGGETEVEADSTPDPDPAEPDDTSTGFNLFDWASRIPEGSHLDFEAKDWWDPETGAENRLAFHLSDAAGDGLGYPNAIGTAVGLAELYVSKLKDAGGDDGEQGGDTSDIY